MAPGIEIADAHLVYENHCLFQNLSLSFSPSEWTCLIGPSGVGKTSLLRLIAGLASDATSKYIRATDNVPLMGRISYLGQQDILLPWLSILRNVTIGDKLRGKKTSAQNDDEAKNILNKTGLGKFIHAMPSALSGGMKQRALLARTLYEKKHIILMDEPFAALDVITRAGIQDLAAELLQQCTVILVTHDPLEALRLGHRIYIMSGQPARISSQISLEGQIPRNLEDTTILKMQAHILGELSHATEQFQC